MEVAEHYTWDVQDSSKIQDFMTCPRMYFFRHVLGWRREEPNVHLIFGQAVHLAMERIYPTGSKPDFSPLAIVEGFEAFKTCYRASFSDLSDDENAPKTPANFLRALPLYAATYKHLDTFDVLHSEVAGSVMVSDKRLIYFKIDTVGESKEDGLFILEHKTSGRFSSAWANQWSQKTQVNAYTYALSMLYPDRDTYGVKINGLFIKNPPGVKKDGTPKANATDTEFHRIPIQKTIPQLEEWLWNINFWLEFIEIEFDNLDLVNPDDDLMLAFPKNTESCSKYFGCPFRDYCLAWLNPLRKCKQPPLGFIEEHWDPRSKQENAKEVVKLCHS